MLILDAIIHGEKYRLPDAAIEKQIPILYLIRKGINHIFRPVLMQYAGHSISVTWNEDLKELKFISETIPDQVIIDMLNANQGNIF